MHKKNLILELSQELNGVTLPVQGKMPDWLTGSLVRNGPVQFSVNGHQDAHWFDGLGMLHAFHLDKGQVSYSNRFLRSDAYHQVVDEGSMNYLGFTCDPCRTIFKRWMTFFFNSGHGDIHNANINVAQYDEQYVALYETPLPVRFDPKTLQTLGVFDYTDDLPNNFCFESAHPHENTQKNEYINYIVNYSYHSQYMIYRLKKESYQRKLMAEIPVDYPAYMHSFALTEKCIIFVEFPFVVNPVDFLIKNQPFIKNYHWKPERGTTFSVIEKGSGKIIRRIQTEPFFAFHHVNAYEEQGQIVLDIVTYPDASIIEGLATHSYMDLPSTRVKQGIEDYNISLKRFILDLETGQIQNHLIFNEILELPRINPLYDGQYYQFMYAVDARKPEDYKKDVRKVYKINVQSKEVLSWNEVGCYPGEPVFIPSPTGKNEDEGVLMVVVLNSKNDKSFLLCLEAHSLREIARAEVPHPIPQGLHGQYFEG